MIQICYPESSSEYFAILDLFALGPLKPTGFCSSTLIEYREPSDQLIQSKGIRHENVVGNVQTSALLHFSSCYTSSQLAPLTGQPQRILVSTLPLPGLAAPIGWAQDGLVAGYNLNTIPQHHAFLWENNVLYRYQIQRTNTGNKVAWVSLTTYSFTFNGTTSIIAGRSIKNYSIMANKQFDPGWNMSTVPSYSQFMSTYAAAVAASFFNYTTTSASTLALKIPYGSCPSLETIRTWISTNANRMILSKDFPDPKEQGELCLEASAQIPTTDVNVIAFLRELRKPHLLIPKLKNLESLKGLSTTYLQWKYGITLTIADTRRLYEAAVKQQRSNHSWRVGRAQYSTSSLIGGIEYSRRQNAKLIVNDREKGLWSIVNRIEDVGLLPTFENIWDLIPYSFVVDWLIEVGKYLQNVDSLYRMMRYDIDLVVLSDRKEAYMPLSYNSSLPCLGYLKTVEYHRWTTSHCPEPSLTTLNTRTDLSNHWLEATALIIQKRR